MPTRRNRKMNSLAIQTAELAMAVPQVVAHRVTRMAMAGASPSARERREFHRMGAEKLAAFNESWQAMALQTLRANQQLSLWFMRSLWYPWIGTRPSVRATSRQLNNAALGILAKGIAPVHRRAVANAKRLGRSKLK
jgi:hypothetical protein